MDHFHAAAISYNIVEEDDLRDAVKRIEAGTAKSGAGSGQDWTSGGRLT